MPARHLQARKIVLASVFTWIKNKRIVYDHYSTAYRLLTIITITTTNIIYTLIKKQYKLPFISIVRGSDNVPPSTGSEHCFPILLMASRFRILVTVWPAPHILRSKMIHIRSLCFLLAFRSNLLSLKKCLLSSFYHIAAWGKWAKKN